MTNKSSNTKVMEAELTKLLKKYIGNNLISLLVEGSYGNYDIIEGYSDYDLLVLVKNTKTALVAEADICNLSKKYSLDIKCCIKDYRDFENRIKNNNQATRFIGNLDLIKLKKQARLLTGKNILPLIPNIKELIKRDLNCELRESYYHATSPDQNWNIFIREPRNWINYIINMSNNLLLEKGLIVRKEKLPLTLKKYCPEFKGIIYVQKALALRQSKKIFNLSGPEKKKLKNDLSLFLEAYKQYVFY